MHWILAMTAYMGNMPWIILWLSIPWIGSLMTLLGNPNGLYSRRVLGWSIGCFLALSVGLWWANPPIFMTEILGNTPRITLFSGMIWEGTTTQVIMFVGMMFSAIVFLFTWPDGKTAKGLAILGSGLALMVGARLGLPQMMLSPLLEQGEYPDFVLGFTRLCMAITVTVLWVRAIPYLTKKHTDAFDQAPLFGKFMYFLRWCLLFLPFIMLEEAYSPTTGTVTKELSEIFLALPVLYAAITLTIIAAQSWRIPGFWNNVGIFFLSPIMYFVKARYTYRPPLTVDKTALCPTASPEQIAFWNPWTLLNRGMIMAFFTEFLGSNFFIPPSKDVKPLSLEDVIIIQFIYEIGIDLIMALHIYALFQPRAVPYRGLLWCSMIFLICIIGACSPRSSLLFYAMFGLGWLSIIWTLQTGYWYRAILEQTTPIPTPPVLSRFWVLCLLGTSLSAGLVPLITYLLRFFP